MSTNYPMDFYASNMKIIDYQNINKGFLFNTDCSYPEARKVGEIVFQRLTFDSESAILDKLKTGSFIYSLSPANMTIKDSVFKMHHRSSEDFDVFKFEDSVS
jgi:hypothetical protein